MGKPLLHDLIAQSSGLIAGDELKKAALDYSGEMRKKIERDQGGLLSVFDGWFARIVHRLIEFDPSRPWEESVREHAAQSQMAEDLQWDLLRLRLFLDRWRQGRFVTFAERERSQIHYHPRFGTEFGADVLLTCQGAPSLMRWRGQPLVKNVFDFAIYPALIGELRPRTIFEIGSGSGASAAWLADHVVFAGGQARVHSVDRLQSQLEHSGVSFYQGDCHSPATLFDPDLLASEPHPWLVIEDAHENVAAVLDWFHSFLQLGDYLVVEDSDIKRPALRNFLGAHPGNYLVDTHYTDNFGRNATCAADSIFVRVATGATRPAESAA